MSSAPPGKDLLYSLFVRSWDCAENLNSLELSCGRMPGVWGVFAFGLCFPKKESLVWGPERLWELGLFPCCRLPSVECDFYSEPLLYLAI